MLRTPGFLIASFAIIALALACGGNDKPPLTPDDQTTGDVAPSTSSSTAPTDTSAPPAAPAAPGK
ncbi:MAG: hypothetical protein ACRELY_04440 [Polyangiaceae bacterium]